LYGSTVTIDYSYIHHNGGNGIDTTGGHLYLTASSVHDNDGSGIRSRGAVTIKNSSISGNHTTEKGGGIYLFDSYLELINSTIANNLADSQGGGIYIYSWNSIPTTVFLDNATIAKNESGHGGGVYVSGSEHQVTIKNSILANNIAASYPDYMGIFSSGGYNLIENPSGAIFSPGPGDLTLVDPRLGSPEGSTVYIPLLADSPAVNSANPAGCADHSGVVLAADQRGKNRFNRCDIGAYELQPLGYSNMTANRVKASRNEIVEYSIVLDNPASSATSQVWMTDTIPTELVFIPGSLTSSQGQASYLNGKITWNGVIAPQANVSIVYSATISNSAPINKKISNPVDIRGNSELFHRSAVVLVDYFKSYCAFVGKNCTPLYFDDFSNPGSGWPVADDGKNLVEYSNNEYLILVRPPSWGVIARPGFKAADYLVSVAARNPGNVMGSYGIAFGMSQDGSTFYSFEIFPNGWYGLYRNSGQSYVKLAEAFSSAIHQGSATNLIKVKRNGSEIVVFANNQLLTSVTDSNFTGDLYLGLITFSYDQPYVDIRFDNFTVVPLACEGMVFPDLSESIVPPAFENSGSFSCPGK
jgi:uncharacterized repeat protein (TIGR01451 family)